MRRLVVGRTPGPQPTPSSASFIAFRKRALILLLISAAFLSLSCKPKRKWAIPEPIGQQSYLASSFKVTDPESRAQLLNGFYPVEDTWCWTRKDFSVLLSRPGNTAQTRAKLTLAFAVPDLVIQKLKSIKLYAVANGVTLPTATYTKSGDYTYSYDVPPAAFASEKVTVDFHLDKALLPYATELRELGIIVSAVGFELK